MPFRREFIPGAAAHNGTHGMAASLSRAKGGFDYMRAVAAVQGRIGWDLIMNKDMSYNE